jgi:hypothetical protein
MRRPAREARVVDIAFAVTRMFTAGLNSMEGKYQWAHFNWLPCWQR